MSLPTGTRLGAYEILGPLGAGGMGEVYRAKDTKLSREVAIKVLPESLSKDPDALARFEREAQAVSSLNHPNVCTVHDIDEHDGRPFLVMEVLEGRTLREHMAGRPLPIDQLLDRAIEAIGAQLAGRPTDLSGILLDLSRTPAFHIRVYEVATFYVMFHTEKPGKYVIDVCTNLSCSLRGAESMLKYLENKLGTKAGTNGDRFFLRETECLASCGTAPCLQINDVHHENLRSRAAVDAVLAKLKPAS